VTTVQQTAVFRHATVLMVCCC